MKNQKNRIMPNKPKFIIRFIHLFRSIKTKILLAFLLVDFIVSFLLTVIFNNIYTKSILEKDLQSYGNTLGAISNNIDFLTKSVENYARLMISSRDTQTLLRTDYLLNPSEELKDARNVKYTFDSLIGRENIINSIHALELLKSDINIVLTDIALSVGYEDQYYFSKVFKKYYGYTPNQCL